MASPPQHWYPVDAFGRDLSAMAGDPSRSERTLADDRPAAEKGSLVVVAASWEPVRAVAALSDQALKRGYTLVPVVVSPMHVRVGPVVTGPNTRCCYHCFVAIEQKRHSGSATGRYLEGVRAAGAADSLPGFASYVAAHVQIAAALLATCLSMAGAADGMCWYSSHDHVDVQLTSFEGVDGCRRCGTPMVDRTSFAGTPWA
jgi:hypothetical protein